MKEIEILQKVINEVRAIRCTLITDDKLTDFLKGIEQQIDSEMTEYKIEAGTDLVQKGIDSGHI